MQNNYGGLNLSCWLLGQTINDQNSEISYLRNGNEYKLMIIS